MIFPAAVVVAAPAAISVAAAATGSGFDPYNLIGTFITPVIVVVLLLMGKLHTEGEHKRLVEDLDAEKVRTVALQSALTDRVIPALTRSTLVLETVSPLLQTEVHLRGVRRPEEE